MRLIALLTFCLALADSEVPKYARLLKLKALAETQPDTPVLLIPADANFFNTATSIFSCTSAIDCSHRGHCSDDKTTCICDSGYTTNPYDHAPMCNYKQEHKILIWFLQFLPVTGPFGVGLFVIGQNLLGVFQLLMTLMPLFCGAYMLLGDDDNKKIIAWFCILVNGTIVTIIWLIMWILILTGSIRDGNGVELYT
jgi:hypothetical protein